MSQNTLSPSASDGERHAELDEPELLRRILRLDDPAVTGSLHAESLLDLLWISMPELRCYLRGKIPYVLATQGLIRSLARVGLAREASADPEALARLLFLAHSRGDGAVTGAAFIDRAGGLSAHRVLFSGSADESGTAVREMMRLALVLDAAVLVFHISADGDCSPRATHRALHARICAAADLLDVPVVDSWIVAGPSQWASLTDWAAEPRTSPANEDPARRLLTARESMFAESDLGILLRDAHTSVDARHEGTKRARVLLESCGGIPGLAATAPDDLSCPDLPGPALAGVAAALEVARRLGELDLPRRRPRSESEKNAGFVLHHFISRSGEITGVVFLNDAGEVSVIPAIVADGGEGAVVLRRWLLSQAVLTKAKRVQSFTLTSDAGDPEAPSEEPEFWCRLAAMRKFVDFEILDHLRVFGDGGWRAGGLHGRVGGNLRRKVES